MIRILERLIYPLFFVTVVIGLAYWYWTTTPSYALSQIVGAVKNRDCETFEKYVDIESIAYRAIDDVLHGPARESGVFGNFDSMIGVGIIGLFKPEIAEIAKTQVLKFIEAGTLSKSLVEATKAANPFAAKDPAPASQGQYLSKTSDDTDSEQESPSAVFEHRSSGFSDSSISKYAKKLKVQNQLKAYGLSKKGFKGIDYLKIEGATAFVGFKFHSDKLERDIVIEIKMEDAGGYWRVTELSNLNDLINTYLETKDKVESGEDAQSYLNAEPYALITTTPVLIELRANTVA